MFLLLSKLVKVFYVRIGGHMTASDLAYFVSKCLGLGWERFLLWPDPPNHIIVLCFFSTSGHIVSPQVEVFRRCSLESGWHLYTTLNSALAIQRLDWGASLRVIQCMMNRGIVLWNIKFSLKGWTQNFLLPF